MQESRPLESPVAAHSPEAGDVPILRLNGISKRYGNSVAIDKLSLDVRKGEFFFLLGPSGCGKTTTLRILAGFIEPDAGEILLEGHPIERFPSHRRDAAMVFQNYALFPHMTVFENIAFGLTMQKRPKREIADRVHEAMRLVRLPSFEHRHPKQLSGGQQQRVALARALVLRPKLLLLDEPLSNLDAKLRKELREEVLEIQRLTGTTTIFVTHDLEEALVMADRVAVMNHGRIEQCGTPREIFLQPATAFVADFIGHENIIEGSMDGPVLKVGALTIRVPTHRSLRDTARFAIPAPAIAVSDSPMPLDNCFAAKVLRTSFFGPVTRVAVSIEQLRLAAEIGTSALSGGLSEQRTIYVAWNSADMIEIASHAPR